LTSASLSPDTTLFRSETFAMTRRQLLKAAAAAAAAWRLAPWPVRAPAAFAQVPPGDPSITPTLEAFSDTLIPGAKRSPLDRAIRSEEHTSELQPRGDV